MLTGELQVQNLKQGRQIGYLFKCDVFGDESKALMDKAAGEIEKFLIEEYSSLDKVVFLPLPLPQGLMDPPYLGRIGNLPIARGVYGFDVVRNLQFGRCDVLIEV